MISNYSLTLSESVFDQDADSFKLVLNNRANGWQRSTRHVGGFWEGSFDLTGDVADLRNFFYEHLGKHIEEREHGQVTWEGYISKMVFESADGVFERDLDAVRNSISAEYTAFALDSDGVIDNGGFETLNSAGGQIFEGWNHEGDVSVAGGDNSARSARCTNGGFITQGFSCSEGDQFAIYLRGWNQSGPAGQWVLTDIDTGAVINSGSLFGGWITVLADFEAPAGCKRILLTLRSNGNGVSLFDNVNVVQYADVKKQSTVAQNAESVARFGQHDERLTDTADYYFDRNFGSSNLPNVEQERDRQLSWLSWPSPQRTAFGKREPKLTVHVRGYIFTLMWRLVPSLAATTISAAIEEAVRDYGDFVTDRVIEPFSAEIQTEADNEYLQRWLLKQIGYRNGQGATWRFAMEAGRRFVFELVRTEPVHFSTNGNLVDASSTPVTPRAAQCGVWRDMAYTAPYEMEGARLPDVRDSYVEEVIVDAEGNLSPTVAMLPEGAFLSLV